jgi:uncharacterized protein involved in exopolysaccharide biosynthesis
MVEFSLIDVLRRVAQGRYLLLATVLLGLATGLIAGFVWKPWYTAEAVFLPPRGGDIGSSAAMLLGGATDSSDLYLGLLASRTLQDDVIDHVGLKSVYRVNSQSLARFLLSKQSKFSVGRNSLVSVNVLSSDPKLSAQIANAYVDALYRVNSTMVRSSSNARRAFYEQELGDQRAVLAKAEMELKDTEQATGLVLPAGEAQASVNETVSLQTQIGQAEERLAGLLVGATDQNAQVVQARAQLAQLRGQLERTQAATAKGQGIPASSQLPGLTLEVEQKQRAVRQAEAAYELLLTQSARARLAATDPGPQLEIVDAAVPPEFPAGPNRRNLAVYGTVVGFLLGLLYILFVAPLRRLMADILHVASPAR